MAILPITPLDYERYVVAHSPLLVPSAERNIISAPSREPDPIDPQFTKTYRHYIPLQDFASRAGVARARSVKEHAPPLRSFLSVELGSVFGILPESLLVKQGNSELTPQAASKRYEQSRNKITTTMRILA